MKSRSKSYCENGKNERICLCNTLQVFNHPATDQKVVAERQWSKPKLAPKPQKQCDHGLFSDDAKQIDLLDLTRSK